MTVSGMFNSWCSSSVSEHSAEGNKTHSCTCKLIKAYPLQKEGVGTCADNSVEKDLPRYSREITIRSESEDLKPTVGDLNAISEIAEEGYKTEEIYGSETNALEEKRVWEFQCDSKETGKGKLVLTCSQDERLGCRVTGGSLEILEGRKLRESVKYQHSLLPFSCGKLVSSVIAFAILLQFVSSAVSAHVHTGIDMCEPIEIPMCVGMPYNMTRMPNHLHHSTQENARLAIEPYGELVKQNCSADILFFLCAMFAPICTPHFQKDAIPPCRSVCERSRRGCEPLMNKYNFSWPDDLDCKRLPEYDKGVCVSPEAIVSSMPEESAGEVSEPEKHKPKDCKCSKRRKPNKQTFRAGKYNYAIHAMVKSITYINENTSLIRVLVRSALMRDKVHIQENRHVDLWADTDCLCPALRPHNEYLIVGHEDVMYNRLKYRSDTLVSRWQQKWVKKFKGWVKSKPNRKRRKNQDKDKKKRCKNKQSRRCRSKSKSRSRCRKRYPDDSRLRKKCVQRSSKKDTDRKRKNSLKRKHSGNRTENIRTDTNKAGR